MNNQKRSGFSILEMVCFLAIVGVVLAVSTPNVGELIQRRSIHYEAGRIRTELQRLSRLSVSTERRIVVDFSRSSIIAATDSPPIVQILRRELPPAVTALFSRKGSKRIVFYPSGVASPATIVLESSSERCAITISLRGRVGSAC